MAQIMSDDRSRQMIFGPGSPLHFNDRIVAAKTGTSDDFKDASTVGCTPDLAVAIWIGDILDIHHTMAQGSDGVFVATPGFHSFLATVLGPYPRDRWYSQPAAVVAGPNNSWHPPATTSITPTPTATPPTPTPAP